MGDVGFDLRAVGAVGVFGEQGAEVGEFLFAFALAGAQGVPVGLVLAGHRPPHLDLAGAHVDDDVVRLGQGGGAGDAEDAAAFQLPRPIDLVSDRGLQPLVVKAAIGPLGGGEQLGELLLRPSPALDLAHRQRADHGLGDGDRDVALAVADLDGAVRPWGSKSR